MSDGLPTPAGCDGLILLAHGARDPAWATPFERVAQIVGTARPGVAVQLAFLEFMAPGLAEAGHRLACDGCRQIVVLPLFLGTGGHVRRDVPHQIEALRHAYPQVTWQLAPAVGDDARLIEKLAAIAVDHLDTHAPLASSGDTDGSRMHPGLGRPTSHL
ncbi:sirohydrochlorin chelatase [Tepidimonas sp.]|uniref:sirohydrochlorin chelatase n=1 Tax=Tepidimonas sp. TaxID=2002775 RepID=UPI00391D3F34